MLNLTQIVGTYFDEVHQLIKATPKLKDPQYFATGSKLKAFTWSFISGTAEPVGGLIGYAIIKNMFGQAVFGVLFGFTAGIMV